MKRYLFLFLLVCVAGVSTGVTCEGDTYVETADNKPFDDGDDDSDDGDDDASDDDTAENETSGLCWDKEISCGDTVSGTTAGESSLNNYSCSMEDFSGPEVVYKIVLNEPSVLTIQESYQNFIASYFVLSDCDDSQSCLVGSDAVVKSECLQPGNYFIIVDGFYSRPQGDYVFSVAREDCNYPPVLSDVVWSPNPTELNDFGFGEKYWYSTLHWSVCDINNDLLPNGGTYFFSTDTGDSFFGVNPIPFSEFHTPPDVDLSNADNCDNPVSISMDCPFGPFSSPPPPGSYCADLKASDTEGNISNIVFGVCVTHIG